MNRSLVYASLLVSDCDQTLALITQQLRWQVCEELMEPRVEATA